MSDKDEWVASLNGMAVRHKIITVKNDRSMNTSSRANAPVLSNGDPLRYATIQEEDVVTPRRFLTKLIGKGATPKEKPLKPAKEAMLRSGRRGGYVKRIAPGELDMDWSEMRN